jgi:curli biogenesis system outer membrane secretion channel CsgG
MSRSFLILIGGLSLIATAGAQQPKKRVAVMSFDYATVQSGVAALFGSNQDVGKGIADLLVDKLVADGTYSVIEREKLDKVLTEQNFSNSNRADNTTAAQIGRVLGVQTIIVGSITQFGRDDKKMDTGGFGSAASRFGIGGLSRSKSTAVVGITARMIDVNTAEILASATGMGEASRSGTGILGSGGSWAGAGGGALDMRSSRFGATILGEATKSAVNDVAVQLESKASALPTHTLEISGLVADAAADGTLILNIGSRAGVKVGDQYQVKRKIRDVTDPATGRVLRTIEDTVGTVTITEVEEQSSTGKFAGAKPVQVGDTVKNQ